MCLIQTQRGCRNDVQIELAEISEIDLDVAMGGHRAKLESAAYVSIEKTYRGKIPLTIVRITPAETG